MGDGVILLIVFVALLLFMASEMPVAFALGISGALGLVLLEGPSIANAVVTASPFGSTANLSFVVVPLYVLIGMFALHGALAEHVFLIAERWTRRIRGGLGVATIAACAGFAAVTGSSIATAATIGRLAVDRMIAAGYSSKFASGMVAAGGTLGVLIPPSVLLVLYGIVAQVSVGRLLAAGLIPGLISAVAYAIYVSWRSPYEKATVEEDAGLLANEWILSVGLMSADRTEHVSDGGASTQSLHEPLTSEAAERSEEKLPYRSLFRVAAIMLLVLAGIYTGTLTITESGAIAALAAFVFMVVELRRKGIRGIWLGIRQSLEEAASITSLAFLVLVGSSIFSTFLIRARIPITVTESVVAWQVSPWLVVLAVLALMIPLGMVLDSFSILVIVIPIAQPVVVAMGYDSIWFGILAIKVIEIGLVSPPFGINAFVVAGSAGVPAPAVFHGVVPFIGIDLLVIALLFFVPALVLWLPNVAI